MSWTLNSSNNNGNVWNTSFGSGGNNQNNQNNQSGGFGFQQPQQQHKPQFVTHTTKLSELSQDNKEKIVGIEKHMVSKTNRLQKDVDNVIEKLERLPDMSNELTTYCEQVKLLQDRVEHYSHELIPFNNKLKSEFVHANQCAVDIQRSTLSKLAPSFYWDKSQEFKQEINKLHKAMTDLEQYIADSMTISNNLMKKLNQIQIENQRRDQDNHEISSNENNTTTRTRRTNYKNKMGNEMNPTQAIVNALKASHRSTLNMASQVIAYHNQIETLKRAYREYRSRHFGDTSDPFARNKDKQRFSSRKQRNRFGDDSNSKNGPRWQYHGFRPINLQNITQSAQQQGQQAQQGQGQSNNQQNGNSGNNNGSNNSNNSNNNNNNNGNNNNSGSNNSTFTFGNNTTSSSNSNIFRTDSFGSSSFGNSSFGGFTFGAN